MNGRSALFVPIVLFLGATFLIIGFGAAFAAAGFLYSWLFVVVGVALLGVTALVEIAIAEWPGVNATAPCLDITEANGSRRREEKHSLQLTGVQIILLEFSPKPSGDERINLIGRDTGETKNALRLENRFQRPPALSHPNSARYPNRVDA